MPTTFTPSPRHPDGTRSTRRGKLRAARDARRARSCANESLAPAEIRALTVELEARAARQAARDSAASHAEYRRLVAARGV